MPRKLSVDHFPDFDTAPAADHLEISKFSTRAVPIFSWNNFIRVVADFERSAIDRLLNFLSIIQQYFCSL